MANERFFKISALKIIITIFASSATSIFFDLYDMERTNYFEGYVEPPPQSNERNALKMESYKWPNGVVPFIFDTNYSDDEQSVVLHAMQVFFENTCVKFTPKTDDDVEHIRFTKSRVCGSNIGYRAGRKEPLDVTYSQYCLTVPGAVQHELFHVLGLLHEQCRPDRDDHITVVWENIEPQYHQNFRKADDTVAETFGLPYDFDSLMHYPANAFAKPGTNVTMFAKENPSRRLGQSNGPTFYDLEKIRKMYNCQ